MKNSIRRAIAAAAAAVMTVSAFSGCGSSAKENADGSGTTTAAAIVQATLPTTSPLVGPPVDDTPHTPGDYIDTNEEYGFQSVNIEKLMQEWSGCEEASKSADTVLNLAVKMNSPELEKGMGAEIIEAQYNAFKAAQEQLHTALTKCTAETVYVENMFMAYDHFIGYYTGDWKGLGPSGKGTFNGIKPYMIDDEYYSKQRADFNTFYIYNGDWAAGVPDGEGQYIYQLTPTEEQLDWLQGRSFQEVYKGQMKNGKKNGKGRVTSVWQCFGFTEGDRLDIFDEGSFRDNELIGSVQYVSYDDKGLVNYGTAAFNSNDFNRGYGFDGNGALIPATITYDRTLAEQEKEKMQAFDRVFGAAGALFYLEMRIGEYNRFSCWPELQSIYNDILLDEDLDLAELVIELKRDRKEVEDEIENAKKAFELLLEQQRSYFTMLAQNALASEQSGALRATTDYYLALSGQDAQSVKQLTEEQGVVTTVTRTPVQTERATSRAGNANDMLNQMGKIEEEDPEIAAKKAEEARKKDEEKAAAERQKKIDAEQAKIEIKYNEYETTMDEYGQLNMTEMDDYGWADILFWDYHGLEGQTASVKDGDLVCYVYNMHDSPARSFKMTNIKLNGKEYDGEIYLGYSKGLGAHEYEHEVYDFHIVFDQEKLKKMKIDEVTKLEGTIVDYITKKEVNILTYDEYDLIISETKFTINFEHYDPEKDEYLKNLKPLYY